MIFSCDKIYDHKFPVTTVRSLLIVKQEKNHCIVYPNETTRAYICYRKLFRHKQSQKGAKFTHKIHKIAIIIRHFTRAP